MCSTYKSTFYDRTCSWINVMQYVWLLYNNHTVHLDGIKFSATMSAFPIARVLDLQAMPDIFTPGTKILYMIGCLCDHHKTTPLHAYGLYHFLLFAKCCTMVIECYCTCMNAPLTSIRNSITKKLHPSSIACYGKLHDYLHPNEATRKTQYWLHH